MLAAPPANMARVPFFFRPREIAGLRQLAPPPGVCCSRFEVVASCIWRSRTAALGYAPDEEVQLSFIVNARGRPEILLPEGFYGNAFAYSIAAATAGELWGHAFASSHSPTPPHPTLSRPSPRDREVKWGSICCPASGQRGSSGLGEPVRRRGRRWRRARACGGGGCGWWKGDRIASPSSPARCAASPATRFQSEAENTS